MIVLPWWIRMSMDIVVIFTPFVYLDRHPTTHLFEYFQNKRRIGRRLTVQQLDDNVNEEGFLGIQQSKKLYKDLGIEF